MPSPKAILLFLICLLAVGFMKVPFLEEQKKPEITLDEVKKLIEKKEYKQALKGFKTLPPNAQDKDYRFLNFFLLAVNKLYPKVASLATSDMEDYILADYLLLYSATALNETKEYEKAIELLKNNEKRFMTSRLQDKVFRLKIEAAIELKKLDEASKELKKWGETHLSRNERTSKLFLEGRVLEESGRVPEAVSNYRRIYVYYPLTPSAPDAEKRLVALKSLNFTSDEVIARTKKIIAKGYLSVAQKELHSLRKAYFKSNNRELLFYLSKLYLKTGKKDRAKKNFELFAKYAEEGKKRNSRLNALLPQAKYEIIVREWNKGRDKQAIAIRNWLVKHYPNNEWTAKSTWILGKMAENKSDFPTAINYYREFLRFDSRDDATYWRLGWVYYLSGDYPKSAENFLKSRQHVKDAYLEQQILFWLGMAYIKDKKERLAEATFSSLIGKYKNTYYGFLAIAKAAESGLKVVPKPYRTKPLNLNGNPVLDEEQKLLVARIEKLNSLGLSHIAAKEVSFLDKASSRNDVSVLYLSNLYKESKAYYQSHRILLSALMRRGIYNYDNLPKDFLQILMPRHYYPLIQSSGERHKVSPYFVLSLIRQESSFNPEAISSAGAVGLMQLMPKTAKRTFKRQKLHKTLKRDAFTELVKPENNIEIGIAHINELAKKMGDSPVEVIASYNAGKGAVASWLKRFDKSDLPIFIERITYPETRNYVKKVATNIFNYEAIYGKVPLEEGVFGSPKTIFEK